MSDLDAFRVDPGVDAGRIVPRAADTGIRLVGSDLFCLGHDAPGFRALLAPGNYVEITQTGDFTGKHLLTFKPRTRAVDAPPTGYSWVASIRIDGVTVSSRTITGSTPEDWTNWTTNISKVTPGDHALAFRLTFTGPLLPGPPGSPLVEVEIPAFYVEDVALVTSVGPIILNQQPDPTQGIGTGTPPAPSDFIDFDIVDLGGSGILPASIGVTVNGTPSPIPVIVAGVVQSGFTGTITSPSSDTRHVHVKPNTPFASDSTVTVSVTATTNAAAPLVPNPTTWSFRVADIVPPTLAGVTARALQTLRVTWSEPVEADDPSADHDALNPDLYTLEPQITIGGVVPAVTPIVTSVAPIDAQTFDLTTDIALTPGVAYSLVADGVEDPSENSTSSIAFFDSFVPPKPAGRSFDLYRLLPLLNRSEDMAGTQDLLRFIRCLQEVCDLQLYDIDLWTNILDPDLAPERFVDAMLADLGNPFPFVLAEIDKRRLARLLVAIYQQKGTAPGIINVVRFFLGITVTIVAYDGEGMILGESELGVDWILGPGTSYARYSFRVVSAVTLTADQRARILFLGNYMKPAHTHLIELLEPSTPPVYDPLELGRSELGVDWLLH